MTPRFSLSASRRDAGRLRRTLLDPHGRPSDIWFTSHLNENLAEVATVADLFPGTAHYLDTYHRHGLVTERSVFAHNVHPTDHELDLMGEAGAWTAHCPTSNSALGSGLFPLRRHVEHGVGVALGSDVGAGTGLFLPKEGLQAYFMQQLLGAQGLPLTPVHLLYLATRAGARALGLADRVGTSGRSGLRRRLVATGPKIQPRHQPAARRGRDRRAGPDLRAGHSRRRRRRVAEGGTRLCPRTLSRPGRTTHPDRPPPAPVWPGRARISDRDGTRSPAAFSASDCAPGVA